MTAAPPPQQPKSLLDTAPVGVCVAGDLVDGYPVHYANDIFYRILRIERQYDAVLHLADTFGKEQITDIFHQLEATQAAMDFSYQTGEGHDIPLKLSMVPILFQGQPSRALWIEDMSEAYAARIEAERVADMKSSFLATMSHEIRTPMQSIYGLLEIIGEEEVSEDVHGMVTTAKKSASDLLEILDDILDVAKVDAGKMELDIFEVPVRTLAYGVLECMEVKLSKDVKLVADIAKDVPILINGDPTRLRQVMLNLIGNAMKFTEAGTVTLRVTTETRRVKPPQGVEDALALRFEIIDTGIGMSEEVSSRLFQAFVQADNSTTRKFGGTGLGLSISQKLITLMGGEIGVISKPGEGSTFWFEIPSSVAGDTQTELPSLKGLVILSVEDHPQGAKEIYNALKSMGAEIESCATYKEGLELMRRRPFDVAVIDQGLPDGLGIDLMREAIKLRPFMGLIMYTVRDDLGLQYAAKSIGAKYLSKPAGRLGLGEAVKSASRKSKNRVATGPQKLLIAEDTEAVRDILRRQLAKLGVEADFVANGQQALQTLEKKEHGILFTDLHMPEMDGYQLVSAIRSMEDNNGVDQLDRFPVVVITADVQMGQRQTYLSYGFDECLLKPVSLGQFKQLLIRWGVMTDPDAGTADAQDIMMPALPSPGEENTKAVTDTPSMSVPEDALSGEMFGKPILDQDAIVEQMGGLDEGTVEMLGVFIGMTEPLVEKLEASFAEDDQHGLRETAHSIKGAARSACCMALGEAASNIQDLSERHEPITGEMIADVRTAFEASRRAIAALKPA